MPKVTLSAVNKQIAELQKVAERLRINKDAVIKEILSLMSKNDVTLSDLIAADKAGKAARQSQSAGGKYRNPETGETWTGRGRKPKWILAAEKAGRALSSLATG